ncbi:2782_t:CDS:10, partial [Acaulospora morrowiae]
MKGNNTLPKELNTGEGKNRYKYKPFNALVESLKIDVSYRSDKNQEEPEGLGSFFHDSLESWKEFNLSTHFAIFVREVSQYCQSLPQILYHKEDIVRILEDHLKVKNSHALEPLLDLVTKLARDLEIEFYPYFERIISVIIPLTKRQDVKTLECTFNCIAYLFKYLFNQIIADLSRTYGLIAPLLGEDSQKPYIRRFAAEAFAFLLRNTRGEKLTDIINHIFDLFNEYPTDTYRDGLNMLFYETAQDTDNKLHDGALNLMRELLNKSCRDSSTCSNIESIYSYRVTTSTTIALVHHVKSENFGILWNFYLDELENLQNILLDETDFANISQESLTKIGINLSLVYICLTVRKGSRIKGNFKRIFNIMRNITQYALIKNPSHGYLFFQRQYFKTCVSLITLTGMNGFLTGGKYILDKIFDHDDTDCVLVFAHNVANLRWEHYEKIILPYIVKYSSTHWEENPKKITLFLANLLSTKNLSIPPGTISSFITKNGLIKFPNAKSKNQNITDGLLRILNQNCDWASEINILNQVDLETVDMQPPHLTLVSAALTVISRVFIPFSEVFNSLSTCIKSLAEFLKSTNSTTLSAFSNGPFTHSSPYVLMQNLLGQVIDTLASICRLTSETGDMEKLVKLWDLIIDEILLAYGTNHVVLRGVAGYLDLLRSSKKNDHLFNTKNLEKIYPHLKCNLSSFIHQRRLYSLQILAIFDQFPLNASESSQIDQEFCDIFSIGLKFEQIETAMNTSRNKTILLRNLSSLISTKRVPEFYSEVAPLHCFGVLTINFSDLWSDAIQVLAKFAELYPKKFWILIYNEFTRFNDGTKLEQTGLSETAIQFYFKEDQLFSKSVFRTGGISFECPNLLKYNKANEESQNLIFDKFVNGCIRHYISVSVLFDHLNYYGLLIKTLIEVPHIAEQHSHQLVPLFLQFTDSKYNSVNDNMMDIDSAGSKSNMVLFLKLFAKFKNPRALHKSAELKDIYLRFLTNGDIKMQTLALNCLLTWKHKGIVAYEENLKNFVDEAKFRDELSTFSLCRENGSIGFEHRDE